MKILHFSSTDNFGGAGKASYRLHSALKNAGHSSTLIVQSKESDDEDVKAVSFNVDWPAALRRAKRRLPLIGENLPTPKYMFNLDRALEIDTRLFFDAGSDINVLHFHWVTDFVSTRTIRKIVDYYQHPILWTLMDEGLLTGGCHYSFGCDGFTRSCGNCPQLDPNGPRDRSHVVWKRKHKYLHDLPIVFIAPTRWVAERARRSTLFGKHRIENIPLALDTNVFRPVDQGVARNLLGLPQSKKIIFFGASSLEDTRKGMSYLHEALHLLRTTINGDPYLFEDEIFLLMAGHKSKQLAESLPFPGKQLGFLRDDLTLALCYQAADILVCPSVEDAGPMMIPESMLCGTPVVAFNTGGAPDLIETLRTGYLSAYKDSSDLAAGIYSLLTKPGLTLMRIAAHEVAEAKHSPSTVVRQHLALYRSLLVD